MDDDADAGWDTTADPDPTPDDDGDGRRPYQATWRKQAVLTRFGNQGQCETWIFVIGFQCLWAIGFILEDSEVDSGVNSGVGFENVNFPMVFRCF